MGKYSNIWEGIKRVLEQAEKPDREEFINLLKLTLLGFMTVGALAFLVHYLILLALQYGNLYITP
ncbi:MAG TPA: preprotein translocase subunit SecE [Ignisphaera sp.]|uniref:Preprotein translocase subunit SecE n=1 Tax=Ignisphaera aggregans TaxID=334771 RepID=A0A832Z154_9CREN|nr:preprotein translocase subunit SecE [Ignisphaera sp.]HIP57526.1 preprotein translocase subunit SecE [Ignisphaera aggregans]